METKENDAQWTIDGVELTDVLDMLDAMLIDAMHRIERISYRAQALAQDIDAADVDCDRMHDYGIAADFLARELGDVKRTLQEMRKLVRYAGDYAWRYSAATDDDAIDCIWLAAVNARRSRERIMSSAEDACGMMRSVRRELDALVMRAYQPVFDFDVNEVDDAGLGLSSRQRWDIVRRVHALYSDDD